MVHGMMHERQSNTVTNMVIIYMYEDVTRINTDSKKQVSMRKVGDFCEKIYLNSDIFGTK